MKDRITKEKISKYKSITTEALGVAITSVAKGKEKKAKEIVEMVSCYLSDSEYFEKRGDLVNALAALSYAHGWLDAGARLKIFRVKDKRLFTI